MPDLISAPIDKESVYPALSLTKWGDPVLQSADLRFKQAQELRVKGDFDAALAALSDTLRLVIEAESALFVHQYLNLLIHRAYCYSEQGDFTRALAVFEEREAILRGNDGWYRTLPEGLKILTRPEYGREELLAQNWQEKAIALFHLDDSRTSLKCFHKSSDLYLKLGHPEAAFQSWVYLGELARHASKWKELLEAGKAIPLCYGKDIPVEVRVTSCRYRAEAFTRVSMAFEAREAMRELAEISRSQMWPGMENDLAILAQMEKLLG